MEETFFFPQKRMSPKKKLSVAPCSMKVSALAVIVVTEQDKADLGRALFCSSYLLI
ncbi:hypothetical protein [Mucilaginibacter gilvus]|uniref:hypothetical protein n=1 Tax=Mucilaginibacter gilvus TaxID=2305909 RepID=UPI001419C3D8|nr:hypothetical protein [Mucilaginibacter gilvus]